MCDEHVRSVLSIVERLEDASEFSEADELLGEAMLELVRLGSDASLQQSLQEALPSSRWSRLCDCQIHLRHARWSVVVETLMPLVDKTTVPSGADAVWAGRSANFIAYAAGRMQDHWMTVAHFDWVDSLCECNPESRAIWAQMRHYYGHYLLDGEAYPEAERYLCEALEAYREPGTCLAWKRIGASQVLDTLGAYYSDQGNLESAERCFRESISLKDEINDKYGQAVSFGKLGQLYAEAHDLVKAEKAFQRDLELCRELNDESSVGVVLIDLANVYLLRAETEEEPGGNLAEARRLLEDAQRINERTQYQAAIAFTLLGLARCLLLEARPTHQTIEQAQRRAEEATERLKKVKLRSDWSAQARIWRGWAEAKLAVTTDDLWLADERYFVHAITQLRETKMPVDLAEALFQRARMLYVEGDRLGQRRVEVIVNCLCEAISQVNEIRATGLAARYIALAQHVDPTVWVQTIVRSKALNRQLSNQNRLLESSLEERLNTVLLSSHEMGRPISDLEAVFAVNPPPKENRVRAHLSRLRDVQTTLAVLKKSFGDEPTSTVIDVGKIVEVCEVQPLIAKICESIRVRYQRDGDGGVEVTLESPGESLSWTTVPRFFEHVVYNVISNAADFAMGTAPVEQRRVWVGYGLHDSQLRIQVYNMGEPLRKEDFDSIFGLGARGVSQHHHAGSQGHGLYLARYFARWLDGDVIPITPPYEWSTAFRIYFNRLSEPAETHRSAPMRR